MSNQCFIAAMPNLSWSPGTPPPNVLAQLKRRGWAISASDEALEVLTGKTPSPKRGPWVWLVAFDVTRTQLQQAVDRGAVDVIDQRRPTWLERLMERVDEAAVSEPPLPTIPGFVANSAAAKATIKHALRAAQSSMPVLLTGETGTGKELIARLLHQFSSRKAKTFVPINCAAIPNELMEGELFGYVKGAFSGATRDYDGQLVAGDGGSVFLDEIDETPLPLQAKLLRVLEDKVVSRLGENVWRKVDFRIVAATNSDLKQLIDAGRFGADVYERLSTIQIELPPLRARTEDLPALTTQLIERYYQDEELNPKRPRVREVTPEALEVLGGYAWPGNVRELRNVIYGALVIKRSGSSLLVSDLPRRLWVNKGPDNALTSQTEVEKRIAAGTMNLANAIEELERVALNAALQRANGNAAEAARLLGSVGRGAAKDPGGTVRTMMKRLGVAPPVAR